MFTHILVPLDGSILAECVVPHATSLAATLDSRVTLLHVLERPRETGSLQPIDPVKWHLKKQDAGIYLDSIEARFQKAGLNVEKSIQEGAAAENIINYANTNQVDLIVLSTHGASGLNKWNLSSVVQKIILRANKSTLLVRAHRASASPEHEIHYNRLFIGLDCSARAELILPVAIRLANRYKADLIIGTVVQKPEIVNRMPISKEDARMIDQFSERNQKAAAHYLEQIQRQLLQTEINVKTRLIVSDSKTVALHNMVEAENADMVLMVAHGRSGEGRWPYGSVAASFIDYGSTSLLIIQDLPENDFKKETTTLETQGH
jgi:nucleotide-binding universal stress UspA family protein